MNAMTHILYQIEQAHADAGQFTDMLSATARHQQAGGEPRAVPSDTVQRDDPPANDLFVRSLTQWGVHYYELWALEIQRNNELMDSRRGWRALAIALGAALVFVAWVEVTR